MDAATARARPEVKICGLTRRDDADLAERLGASFLGVILAGGPRRLTVPQAANVLGDRRPGIQRVAVFGAQPIDEMAEVADTLDLDVLQVHRDIEPSDVRWLRHATGRLVWPVLRVGGAELPSGVDALADAAGWLVLDALVPGQLGGTGRTLDWGGVRGAIDRLRRANPALRVVLAGGLSPSNLGTAIHLLGPDVVDVSSGVEASPGVKDPAVLEAFVVAARR
jgi:phosphoribosylanthranilate isomerase